MKIKLPEDYKLPEETEDGGTFEELTTYRLDGGSIVPIMIAGVEILDDEADKDEIDAEAEAVADIENSPMSSMGERIMSV